MKPFKAHKKKEDADYITAESETGTKVLDGVQCPRCGLMFAVIASVNGDEWRSGLRGKLETAHLKRKVSQYKQDKRAGGG